MIIPIDALSPDALYGVIESFVLREGTDYGEVETSLEDKIQQVLAQLQNGSAILQWSELHENLDIVEKGELDIHKNE